MVKDTRDWGKFVAKDLFGPSQLGKYHNPKTLYESDNGYEFICASVMNNGINKSMPKVNGENLSLTPPNIIAWGKQSPFFTYHENPCVTSQGMYFIEINNLTRSQIHFVITVLNKLTTGYNYTNCLIGKKFDELSVPLPLKPDTDPSNYTEDDIDWSYIESTIRELEESTIRELDAYLKETGLDDYTLTDDEREVLEREPVFKEFEVGELFDGVSGDTDIKKAHLDGQGYPVITAGVDNLGVAGYSSVTAKILPANTLTVDMFGNCYFRPFEYKMVTHARVFSLCLKDGQLTPETGMFICTMLQWLRSKYNYSNMCSYNKIKNETIQLPVKPGTDEVDYAQDDIDWDYMAIYARIIEKQVIADVVDYKNEVITMTKDLVEK